MCEVWWSKKLVSVVRDDLAEATDGNVLVELLAQ